MKKFQIWLILGAALVIANIFITALAGNASDRADPEQSPPVYIQTQDPVSASDSVRPDDNPNASDQPESDPQPEVPQATLSLETDPNCPLPWAELVVQQYTDYPLRGWINSQYPIQSVTATIRRDSPSGEEVMTRTCEFGEDQNVLRYDLSGDEYGRSLDDKVSMEGLGKGTFSITISARTTNEEQTLFSGSFTVDWNTYQSLTPADFRNNYAYALSFFGDPERFMFGYYQPNPDELNIKIEKEWRSTYLTLVEIFGKAGYVHVDAEPYLNTAIDYINSTYIRVQGNGHDSGVIVMSDIVETFAGAYVPRMVRNGGYVSHHSFGTAMDFNAYTSPNTLNKKNWEIIRHEVADCLTYNGIKTEGDISYYDFTYTGDTDEYYNEVPRGVQNYLLYELAFYRAGFGWGYYFSHNCDAMHYTLSELDPALHEAEGTGLRKVFEYI